MVLVRIIKWCMFAAFVPQRLVEVESVGEENRNRQAESLPPKPPRAFKVRRALWESLV